MAILNKAQHSFESISAEIAKQKFKSKIAETDLMVDKTPMSDLQWEDFSVDYHQENKFFKSIILTLPLSIVFWATIIYGINFLLF